MIGLFIFLPLAAGSSPFANAAFVTHFIGTYYRGLDRKYAVEKPFLHPLMTPFSSGSQKHQFQLPDNRQPLTFIAMFLALAAPCHNMNDRQTPLSYELPTAKT
ncbi:hypothetical protein QSV34_11910 [Porticoccus sp. W117]|uniref:hypothetical protein n=1 Tax=Porticoccus sp. W117 TaxID=3054777 RepID=UPI0025948CBF|nr:hypothetical protein [Porticoccus sp. W117]MDM3872052.1 hypothetical protein [Porticoccus sp. W117]